MEYFTPQLFVRLQNIRDEAAIEDWDRAVQEYAAALQAVLPRLPAPLRQMVKEFPLHDADVLSMTRVGDTLSVTVRPEAADDLLILSYTLVERPVINRSALPREHATEHVAWLYDELAVELVPGPPTWLTAEDRARDDGRATVCSHSILLSNGWEISLKFRKFKLTRPETLLPSPDPTTHDQEEMLTQSA